MKRLSLKVEERKVLGKKVKKLRREGLLPANIYGKDLKSQAVQVLQKDFDKAFKEVGETQVLDVTLDAISHPVLIKNVQLEPRTGSFLHADFYKVDLKAKIKAMIPLEATGEAKAVADKIGLLLQTLSEVEVEALPTELPEKIEVDVAPLSQLDQQITVADLKLPTGVEILTDSGQVIFKIGELVTKEAEELAKQEEAAATAAAAEAAAERGEEAPAEAAAEAGKPAEEKPIATEASPSDKTLGGKQKPTEEQK